VAFTSRGEVSSPIPFLGECMAKRNPNFRPVRCTAVGVLILLGSLLGTGCSTPAAPPTIVVIGEDSSSLQAMEALKGTFERTTGVGVRFVRDPFDVALQKSNQDLANKTGQYDIVCQYAASLAPYINNDYVFTLDDMERFVPPTEVSRSFEKDFFPGVWRETGFYKKPAAASPIRVSYPFAATTMILVYNKVFFDDPDLKRTFQNKFHRDLLVPTTWEEYLRLAEFFTDPSRNRFGVVMEGAPGGFLYWEWANYAYGMGGGVMEKNAGWEGTINTPITIDSVKTVEATRLFLALKPFNAGDFFSVGSAEKRELFLKNNVAMSIMWSDYVPDLLKSPNGGQFGFTTIPGDKSMLGGATFFLNKATKHPREATRFILSQMEPAVQAELMTHGLGSPFRSVYSNPSVQKIPYSGALRDSLARGVYMIESGPDSQLVQDTVTATIQKMWRERSNLEEGLRAAKLEIQSKRRLLFGEAATR